MTVTQHSLSPYHELEDEDVQSLADWELADQYWAVLWEGVSFAHTTPATPNID